MLNLNYELLKLFQIVMSQPNLKESAERLGVTPSAVSQSLKKLEAELGVQLFLREHKKLVMTSQGKAIQEKLGPTLLHLETVLSDLVDQHQENEPSGTLMIGAPYELGSTFLVRTFGEFQKKYPKVKAQFRFASPNMLLDLVSKGEIDFAISADGVHFKNLKETFSRKKLFDEELIVISPRAWKAKADFQELIKLPHLDYSPDASAIGMWYQLHFKKTPKKLNVPLVAENALALTEGVKAGLGIAMVPREWMEKDFDDSIRIITPSNKKFLNPIVLVQHVDRIPTFAEKKFIASLENTGQRVI